MEPLIVEGASAFENPTTQWQFSSLFNRSRNATIMEVDHVDADPERKPWYKRMNAEPTLFLFSLGCGFIIPITSLFIYYARCVEIFAGRSPTGDYDDLANATAFCMSLHKTNNTRALDLVDRDVATFRIYTQMGNTAATILMSPVIGAFADFSGRRLPFLFVLMGTILYCTAETTAVYLYDRINIFFPFMIAETGSGLFGGLATVGSMAFAVISDDARADKSLTPSSVPLRIALACGAQSVGVLIGSSASSVIESIEYETPTDKIRGYLIIYLLATLTVMFAFLYSFLFLKDNYRQVLIMNQETALVLGLNEAERPLRKSFFGAIAESFSGLLEVITTPRPGWNRLCLNLCIVFMFVEFFAFDTQILCLFVKREPFSWSDSTFTNFILARFIASTLGMVLLPMMARRLPFTGKESYLILCGIISGAVANAVLAFAHTSNQIFIVVPLAFFGGAIQPGYRILFPKIVPQEQTARLFSLTSLVLVICPLFSALIFNNIYSHTLSYWPGFVFFVQSILFVVVFGGQLAVHFLLRPMWLRQSAFDTTEALLPASDDEDDQTAEDNDPSVSES